MVARGRLVGRRRRTRASAIVKIAELEEDFLDSKEARGVVDLGPAWVLMGGQERQGSGGLGDKQGLVDMEEEAPLGLEGLATLAWEDMVTEAHQVLVDMVMGAPPVSETLVLAGMGEGARQDWEVLEVTQDLEVMATMVD